ncbi:MULTISPECIES: hypothetical protein [unclassified Parabacteroides]|uniref:hypothetical protein n=1 Tax=unclassified Parabacteroides TaxID=2649774 RepID=UPI002473B322|nr:MULTISPECIES: hypothetical protein [unclassified Parabacteroides]
MKNFFVKMLLFILVLVLLDWALGSGLRFFYFRQSQGKLYNLTCVLEKQTAEILILGSSRAMHQYNPEIMTDSLGLSCYNAGNDGQSILYHNALLDVILDRFTPSMIVLDVNPDELVRKASSYDLLTALNPYVKDHPVLWNTLQLRSPFEKAKHLSKIYPFNSLLARIAVGNMHVTTKDVSANGFTPQYGQWEQPIQTIDYPTDSVNFDKNKIEAMNQLIQKCKEKNIILYMVLSPMYEQQLNHSSSIRYITRLCEANNISFFSYQNDKRFKANELFRDPSHLNAIGADIFTSDIASLLLKQ